MHVSWLWARIGCEWTRGSVSKRELVSNDVRRGISQRDKKTQTDSLVLSKYYALTAGPYTVIADLVAQFIESKNLTQELSVRLLGHFEFQYQKAVKNRPLC